MKNEKKLIMPLQTTWSYSFALPTVLFNKEKDRDFPGGPVVETPRSQCRGARFSPWSGN